MRHNRVRFVAASATLVLAASAQAAIVKGPYLQNVTKTSIVVMWETDSAATGEVRLTTPTGMRTFSAASGTMHEVMLDGLSEDTSYTYTVVSGGTTSPMGGFVTAPSASAPFLFVAQGDNRDGDAEHTAIANAIARVGADFGVTTGDGIANDAATQWTKYFNIEKDLLRSLPLFTSLGNHELVPGFDTINLPPYRYKQYFAPPANGQDAERNYSFTYGNTVFVAVDGNSASSSSQTNWLRGQLMTARANPAVKNIIVMGHHGVYSSSNHGGTSAEQTMWAPLFEQYQVELVLQGHDHTYEHLLKGGVHYVTLGGGGAPLYDQDNGHPDKQYSLRYVKVHHFAIIRVDGDFIELRAQQADGTMVDTFSIGTPVGPTPDGGVVTPPDSGTGPAVDSGPNPTVDSGSGPNPTPTPTPSPTDPGGSSDAGCGCSAGGHAASGLVIPLVGLALCGILIGRARRRRSR